MSRQLAQGFSLITSTGVGEDNSVIIFAVRESEYTPTGLEYVTGNTLSLAVGAEWDWGHYFADFDNALEDYRKRCETRV